VWVINATVWPLYPWERDPVAIVQDGWYGRARQNSPPSGFGPQTVHPVTSCYTDCIYASCLSYSSCVFVIKVNPLTPIDPYSGRTAPLTSKGCILYIYSTNRGTQYFKHGIYCPFFSLQNAVCFIILTYLVLVLFTFYIQSVLK